MDYTFYPCRADGSSIAFDVAEVADDEAAQAYAYRVLDRHLSAVTVEIWTGERRLAVVRRMAAE